MLIHPTLEKLRALKLEGFARGLEEQRESADIESLGFEERLGLLVDREMTHRENKRLAGRLHKAKLRQTACLEDVDFRHPRGLDRSLVMTLGNCQWISITVPFLTRILLPGGGQEVHCHGYPKLRL